MPNTTFVHSHPLNCGLESLSQALRINMGTYPSEQYSTCGSWTSIQIWLWNRYLEAPSICLTALPSSINGSSLTMILEHWGPYGTTSTICGQDTNRSTQPIDDPRAPVKFCYPLILPDL